MVLPLSLLLLFAAPAPELAEPTPVPASPALTLADAPAAPLECFLVSALTTGAAYGLLGTGAWLTHGPARVDLGVALAAIGLLIGSFTPNLGDLMVDDDSRFALGGTVRLAIVAIAAWNAFAYGASVLQFALFGALWVGMGVYSAVDTFRAPDRWLSRLTGGESIFGDSPYGLRVRF